MAHSLLVRGASLSLTFSLMLPAFVAAAGSAPLGTLRSEGAVFVDSSRVPAQSALFSGDRVATAEGRAAVSLPHGSSVLIDRSSDAALLNSSAGLSIGLRKGKITLHSAPMAPLQVETAGLRIAARGKFPSLAEVAMLADGSVSLAVHRGAMEVRGGGKEPILVKAGRTLTVGPQTLQAQETPGTAAHGSKTMGQKVQGFHLSHSASVMVIGAAVAATAAAVGIAVAANNEETPVSPSAP
ncbi:MAG: FecR domain-containing protein [Acidobacteria bacterium]|nr:FecR domain-containing protein [Acidobacteriota bacterium]